MRTLSLLRFLTLSLIPSTLAADDPPAPHTFNGKSVPPITELGSKDIDSTISKGYWFVEYFSPYCHHCQTFAPTWETLYEYYYTQEPIPQAPDSSRNDDLNSFTHYYDFHFARVDCVVNADKCVEKDIPSFPSIVLYRDGEQVKLETGVKDMKHVSDWVEGTLESIRPGSRPQGGPKLPEVGATSAEAVVVKIPGAASTATGKTSAPTSKSGMQAPGRLVTGPKVTPNQDGLSIPLTAEKFQRQVTLTRDPWFIKFYAPWCHHCQALAPNWAEMARQMKGQINIGEVNCEVEKRLCKDVKIRSYPTLSFIRGGEKIEYDGLRGLGDLLSFANKAVAVGDGVTDVSAGMFEEMEKKEEVIFLYFYDHATTSEDLLALDRLVMSLIGHAKLVKTNDTQLAQRFKVSTWPRLLVSRDGKATIYNGLSPRDMRDYRKVLNWMQSVWLPIVPELTASNAKEVMYGRLVVLGILNRDRPDEFAIAKREIKNAALEWIDKQDQAFRLAKEELRYAKQLRIEEADDRGDDRAKRAAKAIRIDVNEIERERKEVGFAWVDGVFWERWIRTTYGISVAEGDKVIVNDEDNKRYWDTTFTGNSIVPSRTSILETLPRIVANPPKIAPKSTTTALGHVWWVIRGQFVEHPIVSAGVGLILFVGLAIWSKKAAWRQGEGRGYGYFKVGEKGGPMDGLLGVNGGVTGGKKD